MQEIWKDIKGYEGYYQVSNLSRVKSLGRIIFKKNNVEQIVNETILNPYKIKIGYLMVTLRKNGPKKHFKVHRLVAIAFIPNPLNKPTINHKNGIKDDNRLENLEWATYSENTQHAYDTGLNVTKTKKVLMLSLDDKPLLCFYSITNASKEMGICRRTINGCCTKRKKHKSAGGYKWEYAI